MRFLKTILTSDPIEAVEFFDKAVREGIQEQNDVAVQETCKIMANYIRHSSVFKRNLIFSKLQKASLLSRFYLSLQFHSFKEDSFPRRLILSGTNKIQAELSAEPHRRHHVSAVGANRYFNLGVISDGSPVDEPHLVCVPPVIQIEMTNTHTVFLTSDNRLFGCGKAASFLPDRIEESEGGYVALPTEIVIPNVEGEIVDVRVEEGGTRCQIGEKWYFIGKPPKTAPTQRISSNCSRIVQLDIKLPNLQCTNVALNGSKVKIFAHLENGELYWDRYPDFRAKKKVELIANGFPIIARFTEFQVLQDGSIFMAHNELLKGKLEFWKNIDDGFVVKNGTELEHFDTKYTLVALVNEVPGSVGTELFKVSPDGHNLIMKKGYRSPIEHCGYQYKSTLPHLILKNREEQGDFVEIPMDMTFCFHELEEKVDEHPMNRTVFEMMFSDLSERILNKELHFPYIPPYLKSPNDLEEYVFEMDLEHPRQLIPEFVPPDTESSMIWLLTTTDGEHIACHKYPLLLHSRQVGAMQRFNSTLYGDCQEQEETVKIETHSTAATVRNALRGMLNPVSLFDIKTIELIECINFYDYLLMDELFDDAFHVLMETVNDFTLPLLFELFWSFEDKVVEGLVERPHLLFDSISPVFPPNELIVNFCEKMGNHSSPLHSSMNTSQYLLNYESEDIVRHFLNLDEDSEGAVWRVIHEDYGLELRGAMETAMRRKESKKVLRSRNNSYEHSTTSPIQIPMNRERTTSGNSFSMSPITKSLPIPKNSFSNSLDDFPEMSPLTPSKCKSPGGRFVSKGKRFVNAHAMLKLPMPTNAWKAVPIQEEAVKFDEVVKKEQKLQKNIRTGFKKVQLLPHVETEELAGAQILEVFRRELHDEALICVELVLTDDLEVESEQIVWGNMPGLVRR